MLNFLLQGMTLGLSASALPGPYQAFIISQSLKNGWRRTLPAAFAPLLSELPVVALILLLLVQVPPEFLRFVRIAGGFFVLYLAWGGFKAFRDTGRKEALKIEAAHTSLLKAMLMNLLSPGLYIYWSLITGPIVLEAWRHSPSLALSFFLGFYCCLISGNVTLVMVFGAARHLGAAFQRALLGISSLALLGFGFYQLWQGFTL